MCHFRIDIYQLIYFLLLVILACFIKNWAGSEILLYLQISKLASHNFMDADRRHDCKAMKNSLLFRVIAVARVREPISWVSVPTGRPRDTCILSGLYYRGWILILENLNIIMDSKYVCSLNVGRGLFLSSKAVSKPVLSPEGDSFSQFRDCSLYKHPWKNWPKQRQLEPLLVE